MTGPVPIAQLNIWLDLVGPILPILAFCGIYIGHLSINAISGRLYSRFIGWQWPHHLELPCIVRRIVHLALVIVVITLILTGLYIRFPFLLPVGNRLIIKYLHYAAAITLITIFIFRVCYAFFHRNKDYREFALTRKDLAVLLPTIKYYAFMASSKPHISNYNPIQKATYGFMVPCLLLAQIATGFALLFSPMVLNSIAPFAGGLATARIYMRFIHYAVTWFVIAFMLVHVYLAITEDLPAFLYFFLGIKPKHGESCFGEKAYEFDD